MKYRYKVGFAACHRAGHCKHAWDDIVATCEHQAALQLYDFLRQNKLFGVPIKVDGHVEEYTRPESIEGRLHLFVETNEELEEMEAS